MNPYDRITKVVRSGEIIFAFDADGRFIAELDEEGLRELKQTAFRGIEITTPPQFDVRVRTTGPIYLQRGSGPALIDGVRLNKGDRVLVVEQPERAKNGIYVVHDIDEKGNTWLVLSGTQPVHPHAPIFIREGRNHANSLMVGGFQPMV